MLAHRRGRSLSEGLTLEESEQGRLVISSIDDDSSANQGLREGEEVVGAAITFDELSKEDVLKVLRLMEPYNDKVRVLTKDNLSKSLSNLDKCTKSPAEMLKDSYSKLYNAKIKKFINEDTPGAEGGLMNGLKVKQTRPHSSQFDTELPRLGVDFGVLKTKTPSANQAHVPDLQLSGTLPECPGINTKAGIKMPNMDVPSVDMKMPSLERSHNGIKTPDMDLKTPSTDGPSMNLPSVTLPSMKDSQVDLKIPDADIKMPGLGNLGPSKSSEFSLKTPGLAPDVDINAPSGKFNMPNFGLSGIQGSGVGGDLEGPDIDLEHSKLNLNAPDVDINMPSSKLNLDADAPSGKLKMPKFKLFGTLPKKKDADITASVKTPNLNLKSPKIKGIDAPDMNVPNMDLRAPNVSAPDIDSPSGKFKMPKFGLSGTLPKGSNLDIDTDLTTPDLSLKAPKGGIDAPDLDLPNVDLKAPKLDVKTPDVDFGSPKAKFQTPKFKMPKFDLPSLTAPDIDANFDGPDIDINTPDANIKGPKASLDMPGFDVGSLSGKFKKPNLKMPDFGLSGPKLDGPNFDLKSPDLDISGPNVSGGINPPDLDMPKVDLRSPKLDLNAPDINLDKPSGKLKMPKMNLSGTLPKGPDFDMKTDLKRPDLSLKAPKLKGGIDTPDLDLPTVDLKAPQLDVNTPDVNIGSPRTKLKMPKLKMPKFKLPSLKGPDIDGNLDGPDVDINAPKVNLKNSKGGFEMPDVNIGSPSGKFKKPNLKMPEVGFSAPKLDSPNFDFKSPDLDVKTPDLSLKAPKIDGGINAPDIDLPNMSLKSPKLDMKSPDVSIDSPNTKFKMPKLKMPTFDISSPKGPSVDIDGDLQTPDLNIPNIDVDRLKGKFKMPSLNTPDLSLSGPKAKTPHMNLSAPKLKTPGINLPDLDLPDASLKSPKLDLNAPDVSLPSGRLRVPTLERPKAGISVPDIDINGPSSQMKMPKMPKFGLSGSLPKGEIDTPNLDINAPNLKGSLDSPDWPAVDLGAPKLDVDVPYMDTGSPSGKFKMPKMPKFGASAQKDLDLGINGNIEGPDMNFTTPKANAGFKGPDFDMNAPSGKILGPQTDLDLPDRKFRLPSLKLPQFGSPDLNMTGSDIDFGAPLRAANPDISPPNAKMNMKTPDLKGSFTGPRVNSSNVDLNMPKVDMQSPQLHLKAPELDIDALSQYNYKGLSHKNRTSDITGANMKTPVLDIDGDVKLTDRKTAKTKARSSYPLVDSDLRKAHLAKGIDLTRADLNIDDFTGKEHILRARGSKMDVSMAEIPGIYSGTNLKASVPKLSAPDTYGQGFGISPSGINIDPRDHRHHRKSAAGKPAGVNLKPQMAKQPVIDMGLPHSSQHSKQNVSDNTDGYYVTVFPKEAQNGKSSKYNTLGGVDFSSSNMDLEVPDENCTKGSTFFFSNLV